MPILSPDLSSVDEFFNIRYDDNNVLIADRMKTITPGSNRIKEKWKEKISIQYRNNICFSSKEKPRRELRIEDITIKHVKFKYLMYFTKQ